MPSFDQLRRRQVACRRIVDPLRRRGGAARGVHDHLERGVRLQHRLVALGELGGVLTRVLLRDREERLVGRERIDVVPARRVAGRRLRDAAVPGGNGAGGVARLLGAERRQVGRERPALLREDRRERRAAPIRTSESVATSRAVLRMGSASEGILDVGRDEVAVVDQVVAARAHEGRVAQVELPVDAVLESQAERERLAALDEVAARARRDARDVLGEREARRHRHRAERVVVVGAAGQHVAPGARRRERRRGLGAGLDAGGLVDLVAAGVRARPVQPQHALVRQVVHRAPGAFADQHHLVGAQDLAERLRARHLELRGVEAAEAVDLLREPVGAQLVRARQQVAQRR